MIRGTVGSGPNPSNGSEGTSEEHEKEKGVPTKLIDHPISPYYLSIAADWQPPLHTMQGCFSTVPLIVWPLQSIFITTRLILLSQILVSPNIMAEPILLKFMYHPSIHLLRPISMNQDYKNWPRPPFPVGLGRTRFIDLQ